MSHATEIRVRWGDTDAGGLIYYPQFFHYVIIGLNDYLSLATDGHHPMEYYRKRGFLLPAVEADAAFYSPLRAGDRITIETTVPEHGTASLTVGFAISRAQELVADGEVTFVFVNDDFEPTSLPEEIQQCIRTREGD